MNWPHVIGIASTIAFIIPVIIIVSMRLFTNKSFLALAFYYLFAFCYNLITAGLITVPADIKRGLGLFNNFFDTPLILFFLLLFSHSEKLSRQIKILIASYIAYELLLIAIFGYNATVITFAIGSGMVVNLIFCTYFFLQQTRITITNHKETGKAVIVAALLFAYGCYAFIYMFYYVARTQNIADVFLVFYLISIISPLMMSAGLLMEGRKNRKVRALKNPYGDDEPYSDKKKKAFFF